MHKAKVVELKKLNNKIYEITLKVSKKTNLEFKTGQFLSIKIKENEYRPYSIASSSRSKNKVKLIISAKHNGLGANYIRNLKLDDIILFNAPYGVFTIKDYSKENYVFIATGAGIAPIYPMILDIYKLNPSAKVTLYFGLQYKKEIFYKDKFETLSKKYKNFNFKYCLSKEKEILNENIVNKRVTENLNIINKDTDYYICGNPFMVKEVRDILDNNNIDKANIHFEKFTIQNK